MPHLVRKYGPILNPLPADHIKVAWGYLGSEYARLERRLAEDESLVATVYLFGGDKVLVDKFGYAGPNLLVVRGSMDGRNVTLYVHQSCLQVSFCVEKQDPEKPQRRIGFMTEIETSIDDQQHDEAE